MGQIPEIPIFYAPLKSCFMLSGRILSINMRIWSTKTVHFLPFPILITYGHFTQWIWRNLLKRNPRRQTEELIKTATLLQELIGDCSPPRVCIRSLSILCCLSPSPDSIKIAVWKCATMSRRLTCAPDLFTSPVKRFK